MYSLIDKALATATPFAAYILPGDNTLRWVIDLADREAISDRHITIHPWKTDAPAVSLRDTITIQEFQSLNLPHREIVSPSGKDIAKEDYINSLQGIIHRLCEEGGKVVISRTETIHLTHSPAFSAIARSIFDAYPAAFRYVCYTPRYGAWMGATPELLFDFDSSTGRLSTMALAGTLRKDDPAEWDAKNLREHRVVADYILDTLRGAGIPAVAQPMRTLQVGDIRHLHTPITAEALHVTAAEIAQLLHPTPAICGYPKARALEIIAAAERHDREIYAGYIMVEDATRARAYVNLRCFRFGGDTTRFFGGGGILSASDPATEWDETTLKIHATRQFFSEKREERREKR